MPPDGDSPCEGSASVQVRRPSRGTRPNAVLGDTLGDVACGVRRVTLQLDHQEVCLPCGEGLYVLHARCEVEAFAKSAAPAPLRCPAASCGT